MDEQYDKEQIYCRKLGHYLGFSYCRIESRIENKGIACSRIMDCWFQRIPVREFIKSNYTEEEQNAIFAPPGDKITTLFGLIEKASSAAEKNGDEE